MGNCAGVVLSSVRPPSRPHDSIRFEHPKALSGSYFEASAPKRLHYVRLLVHVEP